jgi:phosphonate transport system substrate-binding protein
MFRPLFSALAIAAAAAAAPAQPPIHISLGIYSFRKPTDVWKQFQPVTVELTRLVTKQLGEKAEVELHVTQTYEECLEAFVAGEIDIVRFGPASYVLAQARNPKVQLLASEREDSRGVGLIVVREDSPFTTLADLAGKRFAFGDNQSTIGCYLSQAELMQAGITAKDLASFSFLDKHDAVFKAVEIGDYEAGALHLDLFKELNETATHKLRVLHAFDNVPKAWVARAGLDKTVLKALTASLLALDNAEALKTLKVPGFQMTCDSDFDTVRKGMQKAEQFAPAAKPTPQPVPAAPAKGR